MNAYTQVSAIQNWLESRILGQAQLIQKMLIAVLSNGHILVEGSPGLEKTKAIREVSHVIDGNFQRIQFTPD